MGRIIAFTSSVSSLGGLDGTNKFTTPLKFSPNTKKYIRLIECSIPTTIPNIINTTSLNNGKFAVSKNADDATPTWTTCQIDTGVYSMRSLFLAISDILLNLGYYTDENDPPFDLSYNTATGYAYLIIDSTKLTSGTQLGFDFSLSSSLMYDLLGFSTGATTYITDGTFTGSVFPKMNYQGESCSVRLTNFGNVSILNGSPINELCNIPLSITNSTTYSYPSNGIQTPKIYIDCPDSISEFDVLFKTSNNSQMLFYDGKCKVFFEIIEV